MAPGDNMECADVSAACVQEVRCGTVRCRHVARLCARLFIRRSFPLLACFLEKVLAHLIVGHPLSSDPLCAVHQGSESDHVVRVVEIRRAITDMGTH